MSCRFQVFANSFTIVRTADSSSALNAVVGVFLVAESHREHPDSAITASIAKAIRFMVNSPQVADVRLARPAELDAPGPARTAPSWRSDGNVASRPGS